MNIALENLLPILLAFILGYHSLRVCPSLPMSVVDRLSNICLYALLVLMGISVGQVPGIIQQLNLVGVSAMAIAFGSSFAIALVLMVFYSGAPRLNNSANCENPSFNMMGYIKDPLQLIGLVICGFALGYRQIIPVMDYGLLVTVLLYALIFIIAMKLSSSGV